MWLDTLTKLQPAIGLYKNFGFKNISAYYQNPFSLVGRCMKAARH
jgi:ribosomal protein S18 acetylase RimI-like enzyme